MWCAYSCYSRNIERNVRSSWATWRDPVWFAIVLYDMVKPTYAIYRIRIARYDIFNHHSVHNTCILSINAFTISLMTLDGNIGRDTDSLAQDDEPGPECACFRYRPDDAWSQPQHAILALLLLHLPMDGCTCTWCIYKSISTARVCQRGYLMRFSDEAMFFICW